LGRAEKLLRRNIGENDPVLVPLTKQVRADAFRRLLKTDSWFLI
jgi:hypothetical protein